MYFQVKLLILNYYKVKFLKVYLSMLGNIAMKLYFVHFYFYFVILVIYFMNVFYLINITFSESTVFKIF